VTGSQPCAATGFSIRRQSPSSILWCNWPRVCHTPIAPIALISFVEDHRQWFKAEVGLGTRETPLDRSICLSILLQPGLTVIPDLTKDTHFANNPLVASEVPPY
jgi:GAF domain-containing protein